MIKTTQSFLLFLSTTFLLTLAAPATFAKIETKCSSDRIQETKYSFCVRKNPESKALIYFFHGLLGNSQSYNKIITSQLDPLWKAQGLQLPNVIAVSFGGTWLLSEAADGNQFYRKLKDQIFPKLENDFSFDQSYKKAVMGFSMGGFNAAQTFFRNPIQFQKAAFLCPAFHTLSPYSSEQEIKDYVRRTGATKTLVNMSQDIGRKEFKSPESWDMENPFAIADRFNQINATIFIGVGARDQFGFHEGAWAFAELLKPKASKVEFYLVPESGHCSFPSKELAAHFQEFLENKDMN